MLSLSVRLHVPLFFMLGNSHAHQLAEARRIHTLFSLSSHWTTYDVFGRQKISQLRYARPAVLEIAARYKTLVASDSGLGNIKNEQDEAVEPTSFAAMCLLYLEACASDYILPTTSTLPFPQEVHHPPTFDTTKTELLVNDIPSVYKILKASQVSGKPDRSVSIVPSIAGLPLLANLLFASYLLTTNLATQIILYPKRFPSGVAEATPADIASLLGLLANPQTFCSASSPSSASAGQGEEGNALANDTEDLLNNPPPLTTFESDDLAFIFQHLSTLYADGKIVIRPHPFFTSPFTYSHLPQGAPDLFADLQNAELVCFEGGLQYRILTGDAKWPNGTTFGQAVEGFAHGGSGAGVRVLATRRWDSDDGDAEVPVVGLDGDDEAVEKVRKKGKGQWGVLQFYDGKI